MTVWPWALVFLLILGTMWRVSWAFKIIDKEAPSIYYNKQGTISKIFYRGIGEKHVVDITRVYGGVTI